MKMTKGDYAQYVKKMTPASKTAGSCLRAFAIGGLICCLGQGLMDTYTALGVGQDTAATAVSVTLIFLGALLTGLGVYDKIAKVAGAGTLVPITGFANAMVSPALEFKTEGYVTGTAAKMFTISGPVIVFGTVASSLYGVLYCLVTK